jgi:hypothetical protein
MPDKITEAKLEKHENRINDHGGRIAAVDFSADTKSVSLLRDFNPNE